LTRLATIRVVGYLEVIAKRRS